MRPADKHLTPQELDLLLLNPADSRDSNAPGALPPEAQQHLNGCEYCQSVADKCRNAEEALRNLRTWGRISGGGKSLAPGPECPREDIWSTLAAGLMNDEEAGPFITHAATCGWCGPRLKEAMHDLAQDITAEEQEALAKLPSASPGWQRAMAQQLAAASRSRDTDPLVEVEKPAKNTEPKNKERAGFGWWPKLVWAGAGLAVLVVAALVGVRLTREPDVNALLAQTYAQHRTIDLRMSGAEYGPMKVEKGPGETPWPEPFRRAQAILSRDLAKHMDDPSWLQAQARADLFDNDYDGALKELNQALALKPNDSVLRIDKATALYMRAHKPGQEMDYGEAAELLSEVLRNNPGDPVALFNRALVYEKLNNPRDAIKDLEHYLQIDPNSQWAVEAKDHLKDLQQRVSNHGSAEKLLDPAAFAQLANDPAKVPILDNRIEDYQDRAIKEWLPQAYSGKLRDSEQGERLKALQSLGDLLAAHHADQWLRDFLGTANTSPQFITALGFLKQSMVESDSGNAEAAYKAATQAKQFFIAAGSSPGVVRAQWQQLHAKQREEDGIGCLTEAGRLAPVLRDSGYTWISIQFAIDRGACLWKLGRYDQGRTFVSEALKRALASGFGDLRLRNLGMASSAETVAGDFASAWAANEEGLQEYWGNPAAHAVRAHQFYEDLAYASESMKWWHLAIAFATESATTEAEAGNQNTALLCWQDVAKLAIQANELDTAAAATQHVDDVMRSLASSGSSQGASTPRSSRIYREVTLAEIEVRQGALSEAEKKLEQLQPDIQSEQTLALVRSFHLAYAELLERQGKLADAENEYLQGLKVVDLAREKLQKPADQESWSDENRTLYEALVYLEIRRGDSERALNLWEWYRGADIRQPRSFKSVDQYLNLHHSSQFAKSLPDAILLSYALLPQGLVTWITDQSGTRAHLAALDATSLSRQAANYQSLCADPTSSIELLQAQGRRLYEIFIAGAGEQLAANKTLVVDLDRTIGDLPFQALVTPDGRYLAQKYAIVFSPGLLYTQYLRDPGYLSQNSNALVVGSSANTLPDGTSLAIDDGAVREARELAGRFAHPRTLFEDKATAASIQDELANAELFYFSGHALSSIAEEGLLVFDSQRGGTTLWNGRAGNAGLFTNLQLAVLSACSTGRAFGNRREAHGTLVRSMLAAGVPNVVASRWDVDSSKTRTFFSFFYDALFAGKSAPRALQYAETQLMSESQNQHPYYWAAFSAFGHA